jgi:hypothetical protein
VPAGIEPADEAGGDPVGDDDPPGAPIGGIAGVPVGVPECSMPPSARGALEQPNGRTAGAIAAHPTTKSARENDRMAFLVVMPAGGATHVPPGKTSFLRSSEFYRQPRSVEYCALRGEDQLAATAVCAGSGDRIERIVGTRGSRKQSATSEYNVV